MKDWEIEARALEKVARWAEQPDEPTGAFGVVSAFDLHMRAAAIRAEGSVMDPDVGPYMDRPAYELVRRLQGQLDDCDQATDSPERPNNIRVWAVRELLEDYGGRPHRWKHQPLCFECQHSPGWHAYAHCFCGCVMTQSEVEAGKRDEELDDEIQKGLDG